MPEHEIAKHTKAVYEVVKQPGISWKHKFIEIIIEIAIIVFAISLSLLLERWRENAHDRTIEKKFLIGLRTDLRNDITQLRNDSASYQNLYNSWNYLRISGVNKTHLAKDSLAVYLNALIGITEFLPNNNRFEALKGSGELNVIEDDSLQNLILDLYQNKIVTLKLSTNYLSNFKSAQLVPFITKNLHFNNDSSNNIEQLIQTPEMQNYLMFGMLANEAMYRYHQTIGQSEKIIELINKQYAE